MTAPALLAIDPGLPDCGAALFRGGRLVAARWCRVAGAKTHAGRMASLVALLDDVDALAAGAPLDAVVVEWPEVLPRKGARVDPSGFLWTAAVAAGAADRAAALGAKVDAVTPREWKGTMPKEQHQRLHIHMLRSYELALLPHMPRANRPHSDALDAALLGAWWLRRGGWR